MYGAGNPLVSHKTKGSITAGPLPFNDKMRKYICILFILFFCSNVLGQKISDVQFFQALNLDYPGLEQVKNTVVKGDFSAAKHQFVEYLRKRTKPQWYIDWHDFYKPATRNPKVWKGDADRYAKNELVSCGIWHNFGDKIDWTSDYSGYVYNEWTWQLNRLYHWTTLGKTYWATGDEKYAKAFVKQLNSWIDQCQIPAKSWNSAGSAWRSLETGIRMLGNWPNSFCYFLPSPSFDDESIIKMMKSFYEHGNHLREHYSKNSDNWLSVEMCGLYTLGVFFPEFKKSAEWRNYAVNTLYYEELNQFYPDGAQVELAPGYHSLSISSIVLVYKLAKLNGLSLPDDYIKRLETAYEYYQKIVMPNGVLPAVNDSKWVETKNFFKEAADLFPDRKDFLYMASQGKQGEVPCYTSVWMPWAGWSILRTGWDKDALYCFLDVGPFGADHQHEDKLSFILYAYGHLLLTECGNYSYDSSPWRKYTISAPGHNVVRVDGKDQNRRNRKKDDTIKYCKEPLNNFRENKKKHVSCTGKYIEGFGTKNELDIEHQRTITMIDNCFWLLEDVFTPSDTYEHTYETWFHFNTTQFINDAKIGAVYSNAENSSNLAIANLERNQFLSIVIGQTEPEIQGWISEAKRDNSFLMSPVSTPIYKVSGRGKIKESYVMIPFKAGEQMPIKSIRQQSGNSYRLELKNGRTYTIKLNKK